MYLPRPIYESIPAIYLASGLACILLITPPTSIFSAILFCYASWMVWKLRRDYRSRQDTEKS